MNGMLVAMMVMNCTLASSGRAAIATMLMANSMHDVKHTIASFGKTIKGAAYHKTD